MIKTNFGSYEEGEEIAVVMHGPCGRKYVYKGTVVGKITCRGRDYLTMRSMDGSLYDVSMSEASQILTGSSAIEAESHTHKEEKHQEKKETHEVETPASTKYTRVK